LNETVVPEGYHEYLRPLLKQQLKLSRLWSVWLPPGILHAVAFAENLTRWPPPRMKEWNKLLTIPVKAKEEVDKYRCILWWGSYNVQLIKKEQEVEHLWAVAQVLYVVQAVEWLCTSACACMVSWNFIYLLKIYQETMAWFA
jgi:hypothetical protein